VLILLEHFSCFTGSKKRGKRIGKGVLIDGNNQDFPDYYLDPSDMPYAAVVPMIDPALGRVAPVNPELPT
jgi:hypothetical protein